MRHSADEEEVRSGHDDLAGGVVGHANGHEVIGGSFFSGAGLRFVIDEAKDQAVGPANIDVAVHVKRADAVVGRLQRLGCGVTDHGQPRRGRPGRHRRLGDVDRRGRHPIWRRRKAKRGHGRRRQDGGCRDGRPFGRQGDDCRHRRVGVNRRGGTQKDRHGGNGCRSFGRPVAGAGQRRGVFDETNHATAQADKQEQANEAQQGPRRAWLHGATSSARSSGRYVCKRTLR